MIVQEVLYSPLVIVLVVVEYAVVSSNKLDL